MSYLLNVEAQLKHTTIKMNCVVLKQFLANQVLCLLSLERTRGLTHSKQMLYCHGRQIYLIYKIPCTRCRTIARQIPLSLFRTAEQAPAKYDLCGLFWCELSLNFKTILAFFVGSLQNWLLCGGIDMAFMFCWWLKYPARWRC